MPASKSVEVQDDVANRHRKSPDNAYWSIFMSWITLITPFLLFNLIWRLAVVPPTPEDAQCLRTCKIRIAESIPLNVTFPGASLPESTFEAWSRIIDRANHELVIAAYKSSLQGRHVLQPHDFHFANEGDAIFAQLQERASQIKIGMVESFPPKDKGDNEDGNILQQLGLIERKKLEMRRALNRGGKMHSKFLLADDQHFYLGSANLDWRSLNQKMELGFVVEDCPCLGSDLRSIFDTYWTLADGKSDFHPAKYNKEHPLKIEVEGTKAETYIASSPKILNSPDRTWDLDALVDVLDTATDFAYVHVMDYHPLFVYKKPRELWPILDDALRRAAARGVNVRVLSAGIHHPEIGIRFLKSLQDLNGINRNGSVEVKIFKVPPPSQTSSPVITRDRRTHNKMVVTDNAAVVGTSNWSGDYFEGGTTGTALIIKQDGHYRPLLQNMKAIFERNWDSPYVHDVDEYLEHCVLQHDGNFCESEKDPKLLANKQA